VVGDALCGWRKVSVELGPAFFGLRPRFAPMPRAGLGATPRAAKLEGVNERSGAV
jgi:hypothetical protein